MPLCGPEGEANSIGGFAAAEGKPCKYRDGFKDCKGCGDSEGCEEDRCKVLRGVGKSVVSRDGVLVTRGVSTDAFKVAAPSDAPARTKYSEVPQHGNEATG